MGTALQLGKGRLAGQVAFAERYKVLQKILQAIGTHRDAETLFRAWVAELRSVIGACAIGLVYYNDFLGGLQWCAMDIEAQAFPFTPLIRWEHSACRWVYESQQPLIMNLADNNLRFAAAVEFLTKIGMRSACLLPLTTVHRRLGALVFASEHARYFSSDIVDFLTLVADQVAIGMDNNFYFAASELARTSLDRETAKLKLLLELNNAIVSDLELSSLLHAISPCLRRLIQVDAVALILPDSGESGLRLHTLDFPNDPGSALNDIRFHHRDSIAARVFHSGKAWIGNIQRSSQAVRLDPALDSGLGTVCALPLVRRKRVIGVLGLGRIHETEFAPQNVEFLLQVANQVAIAVDNALAHGQMAVSASADHKVGLDDETLDASSFDEVVGKSPALRRVLEEVEAVASTRTSVLIRGETGTGKELIAQALHNRSFRKHGAFIKVNCAALPAGLLESELFGHEKGAFTGASFQRIGRFERANGGTIFLDEIGELPLELQPKLLRVLQDGEFERVGSSRTCRTSARVVAATNRDLAAMVDKNLFREDLFYRLNVFPLHLPPLRDRPEDIPLLIQHFTRYFARSLMKQIDAISPDSMSAAMRYAWPGNIRELQNVIERAVILSPGTVLHIPSSDLRRNGHANHNHTGAATLEEIERNHILSVLAQTNWVLGGPSGAAARLGMKRSTLQFRLQKLGITRPNRIATRSSA